MKKIVAIILFSCFAALACAQFQRGERLVMGERWPTYYYWGDNWIDSHLDAGRSFGGSALGGMYCQPEIARYIYADSSLRVIGIAVAISFQEVVEEFATTDPWDEYQVEHFRLYEVDPTTNEMILLADKPLEDLSVACYLPMDDTPIMFGVRPSGLPVREVYFDSAITVYDSFYVATTTNNNYYRRFSTSNSYIHTVVHSINLFDGVQPLYYPQPNHYRQKLHRVNENDVDLRYGITDTNWHVFHKNWYVLDTLTLSKPHEWSYYMMMFPIIDTTYSHDWVPECKRPTSFGAIHVGREVVVLGWESEGSGQWELKVAKEGTELDSVEAVSCTNDVMPLYGLDTASWYVATVRSLCSANRISEWSDTLRFFVPGDTTVTDPTEGIESMTDKYTYLMPNPASEQVTIVSSFRIDRVEIFTVTGQKVLQKKVGGLTTHIDISDLATGTYLVRTYTNHGVSCKRLVVK